MKTQLRKVQPAHKSDRITVAQAARAFRQVRGTTPKADLGEGEMTNVRREAVPGRIILADAPAPIAADKAVVRHTPGKRKR